MSKLYAVYACDEHRSRDSMRLLTAVDMNRETDLIQLGKLIVQGSDNPELQNMNLTEVIEQAMNQKIDYLHMEEIEPINQHTAESFCF